MRGQEFPLASLLIESSFGPANLGSMLSDCHGVMVRTGLPLRSSPVQGHRRGERRPEGIRLYLQQNQ